MKEVTIIRVGTFWITQGFIIVLPIVTFLYAVYYNVVELFTPLFVITLAVCSYAVFATTLRSVRIDRNAKIIKIKDGLGNSAVMPFGTLQSLKKDGGWYVVTYEKEGKLQNFMFAYGYYLVGNRERMINFIREFNPKAEISI